MAKKFYPCGNPARATMLVSARDNECDCENLHPALIGVPGGCDCECHVTGLVEVEAPEIDLHGTGIIQRLAAVREAK